MATRSFIARPTDTGYTGVYVHYDGYPSGRLPLLLAGHRYRFGSDIEAMARHLIDDVPVSAYGWEELGTDLLHGAPEELRQALTGGDEYPSRTLDDVFDMNGVRATRRLVTPSANRGLDWGYVLRPRGIEVISPRTADHGPIVDWHTDPRTPFSDVHQQWKPDRPPPERARPTPAAPPAATSPRAATPQHTARP